MTQTDIDQAPIASKDVRRRPKNRKAQIANTAATAFSERGYHTVGVDEIAAELGISGPALYRHFPNKYALLLHATTMVADGMNSAIESALATAGDAPSDRLERVLLALIAETLENRRVCGTYRRESRYLEPADQAQLQSTVTVATEQVTTPISVLRPHLSADECAILAAGALSTIWSITAHRTALATRRATHLILGAATDVIHSDLPPLPDGAGEQRPPGLPVTSKRELLLAESVTIFDRRGYHESSIEEIGAAAGINASSVYRHFPSKADLLAAVFHRAADRLSAGAANALGSSSSQSEALGKLIDSYVDFAFRNPAVLSVYFNEAANLPRQERTNLHHIQRLYVDEWASLVATIRPTLTAPETRFLVHSALGLTLDVGRVVRFDPRHANQVAAMMRGVLFPVVNVR